MLRIGMQWWDEIVELVKWKGRRKRIGKEAGEGKEGRRGEKKGKKRWNEGQLGGGKEETEEEDEDDEEEKEKYTYIYI